MIVETGHFALFLALALAVLQSTLPLWGAARGHAGLMSVAYGTALGQLALVALSFAALTHAYIVSDFSVLNVAQNSHSGKPLIYKISGVWGNHEGSMLLWVLVLAVFGAVVAHFGRALPRVLWANTLAVQGWLTVAFLLFLLLTSNPFARVLMPPLEGNDLNPLLQDPGLAIHPPLLYFGYVGFSITFAFAVAALIEGRIDAAWARWVRPWALWAWIFLTLGIAVGSYWAYYELGWGGFWFWDPVENASLLPWLTGTALLHSALVMEKRDALKVWTVLLAILTFSLSLLGTFLVRSGVLTSVHAFAVDPDRGLFILIILLVFIGGALALYAWRAPLLKRGGLFAPVSREGALVLNNVFLTAIAATVFVGTLYPLGLEAVTGQKISVGPPFFNATTGPLALPLAIAIPFGVLLAWKRGALMWAAQRLMVVLGLAIAATLAFAAFTTGGPVLALIGVGLGLFLVVGSFIEVAERAKLFRVSLATSLARARGIPRGTWGAALAHAGVGLMLLGIIGATAYQDERLVSLQEGERTSVGSFDLTLTGLRAQVGGNTQDIIAVFDVRRGGVSVTTTQSIQRTFPARQMTTVKVGLETFGLSQLYVSVGEIRPDGTVIASIAWKPLVLLIWIGPLLMAAGACLSLTDRRRVGVPVRARVAKAAAVAGKAAPAALVIAGLLLVTPAHALAPGEALADPAQEERAQALFYDVRCLVCQNQSIIDSNAPLAADLRALVREKITAGETDAAIRNFLVARYGEFVLMRPRVALHTLALWIAPGVFLLAGIAGFFLTTRRRAHAVPLSEKEEADLATVLSSPDITKISSP